MCSTYILIYKFETVVTTMITGSQGLSTYQNNLSENESC